MNENHPIRQRIESLGNALVTGFHLLALFVIGGSIVWSAVASYIAIMQKGHAGLDDLLLLFIYLELGAMVGIYFKTYRLPVRFLVYVAITALTRFLVVDVKELTMLSIGVIAGAILMLSLAALTLEFASSRLSKGEADD